MRYRFENAEVDTDAFEIRVGGERVPAEPHLVADEPAWPAFLDHLERFIAS